MRPDADAQPAPAAPGNHGGPAITLSNDGSQWNGTYCLLVAALVTDLLSDGAPFDATITFEDAYGDEDTVAGKVTAFENAHVVIDGEHVPHLDIVRIDVR